MPMMMMFADLKWGDWGNNYWPRRAVVSSHRGEDIAVFQSHDGQQWHFVYGNGRWSTRVFDDVLAAQAYLMQITSDGAHWRSNPQG